MTRRVKDEFGKPTARRWLRACAAALASACAGEVTGPEGFADGATAAHDDHREVAASAQALSPTPATLPVVVFRFNTPTATTARAPPFASSWTSFFFGTTGTTLQSYFSKMSNSRFALRNAGIFSVTLASAFDTRAGVVASDNDDKRRAKRIARVLRDNNFPFAMYDVSPKDNMIRPNELGMFVIEAQPSGGINRGTEGVMAGSYTLATLVGIAGDRSQFANYAHDLPGDG